MVIFQKKKEIFEGKARVIYTVVSSFLSFEENEKEIEKIQINLEELSQKEQRQQCCFRV